MFISVTPNQKEWDDFDRMLGKKEWRTVITDSIREATLFAHAVIIRLEPGPDNQPPDLPWVRTGNLRRMTKPDLSKIHSPNFTGAVRGEAIYSWWIEMGEDSRGRVMKIRPGGYRMFEEGLSETAKEMPGIVQRAAEKIGVIWARG